jgi:hypothetical protein
MPKTRSKKSLRPKKKTTKIFNQSFALGLSLAILGTAFTLLFSLNNLDQGRIQVARASELSDDLETQEGPILQNYTASLLNPTDKVGRVEFSYTPQNSILEAKVYYLSSNSCDQADLIELNFGVGQENRLSIASSSINQLCIPRETVIIREVTQEVMFSSQADLQGEVQKLVVEVR